MDVVMPWPTSARGSEKLTVNFFGKQGDHGVFIGDTAEDGDDRIHVGHHVPADRIATPLRIGLRPVTRGARGGWVDGYDVFAVVADGRIVSTVGRQRMRYVINGEPRNGYQIMSEIEERSGGAWRPSPGAEPMPPNSARSCTPLGS